MAVTRYMVADVGSSIKFYTVLLNFELDEQWGPAFAIVSYGYLKLWLSGPDTSAACPMPDGRKPEAGGWNRIVIQVENLEDTINAMKEAKVSFRNEMISGPGGKQILVDDPSGNPIELFQPA